MLLDKYIYKIYIEKKFSEKLLGKDKEFFEIKQRHLAVGNKKNNASLILTTTYIEGSRNIALLNKPITLKTYFIANNNLRGENVNQYVITPAYNLNNILDYKKINMHRLDPKHSDLYKNFEQFVKKEEYTFDKIFNEIVPEDGIIIFDEDTTTIKDIIYFKNNNIIDDLD